MDLVVGGVDSRGGYVSKILYVKTKELGPLGGRAPLDPPMVMGVSKLFCCIPWKAGVSPKMRRIDLSTSFKGVGGLSCSQLCVSSTVLLSCTLQQKY